MANDFSGDANCVALYNFENGAETTDSKGSNTLTDNNTVGTSADAMEGSQSVDFAKASYEYYNVTQANLDAGFPGKDGSGNVDFSACFWMKPETSTADGSLANVWNSGNGDRCWRIKLESTGDKIQVQIGYNGGASTVTTTGHAGDLVDGQYYHVGVTYDDDGGGDSKGQVKIRVWDDTGSAILQSGGNDTYSEDIGQQMNIEASGGSDFGIGINFTGAGTDNPYDGLLDEMVIFNDVISDADIDAIRGGTYGAGGGGLSIPIAQYYFNQPRI